MRHLSKSRWFLAGALVLAGATISSSSRLQAQQAPQGISPHALAQMSALAAEKRARTPVQRKIDTNLLWGAKMARGEAIAQGVQTLEVYLPDVRPGRRRRRRACRSQPGAARSDGAARRADHGCQRALREHPHARAARARSRRSRRCHRSVTSCRNRRRCCNASIRRRRRRRHSRVIERVQSSQGA